MLHNDKSLFFVRKLQRGLAQFTRIMDSSAENRDYEAAIDTLNKVQSNAQYVKQAAWQPNPVNNIPEVKKFLSRSGLTLEHLDKLHVIHVTGTNGKGTTCAYCESILRRHGYKTGFYSSPHLLDVRERIRINGKPISKSQFAKHFWNIYDKLDAQKSHIHDMPLYFRFLTILAFHVFLEEEVDATILEVGIGGEFDCTNVIRKTAVVGVTPLDFDHTALLGNSLESIAWNKSGIMKPGSIAFTTPQSDEVLTVLSDRSIEKGSELHILNKDYYEVSGKSSIPCEIQKKNANLALAMCETFMGQDLNSNKIFSLELAKKAVEETRWPGRYDIIHHKNVRFFLDGAHTIQSIKICRWWFEEQTLDSERKRALIFNLTGDRNPTVFFEELKLLNFHTVIFCPNIGSDNDPKDQADYITIPEQQLNGCVINQSVWIEINPDTANNHVVPSFSKALDLLSSNEDWDVLVTGSLHLIGAAMGVLDPTLRGALS